MPAKRKQTKLTAKQLETVTSLVGRFNEQARALEQTRETISITYTLLDEQYGTNILGGETDIQNDGVLVPKEAAQANG